MTRKNSLSGTDMTNTISYNIIKGTTEGTMSISGIKTKIKFNYDSLENLMGKISKSYYVQAKFD